MIEVYLDLEKEPTNEKDFELRIRALARMLKIEKIFGNEIW